MAGIIDSRVKNLASGKATTSAIPNNPVIQGAYSSAMNKLSYVPQEQRSGIQARLEAIAQGQRPPSGVMGVAAKVLGAPGIKQALAPLSVLDIPRRVVISAGKEYYDLLSGKGDASLKEFYTQAKNPSFGFGDFVDTGNKWVDRIIGFAGDVALDPTTYLTLGTARAAGFGNKIAAAGKLIDAGGDATRAAKLVREGSWFLTPAERELAGLNQAGLYFMGQRIKGTAKVGEFGERAFAKGRLLVSDRQFVQAIRNAFTPSDANSARLALKRGLVPDSDTAKQYIDVIRSADTERAVAAQAGNVANAQLRDTVLGGMNEKTLLDLGSRASDLLENPALLDTATDAERSFVQRVRTFLDELHGRVDGATKALDPNAGVGYQQNYFPHIMTPAAKEYAGNDSILQKVLRLSPDQLRRPGFVEPRRLVADGKTKFFGVVLTEDDLTVKRLNEIAKDGGFKGDFFEPNAIPVLRGYVASHSKEMGRLARFKYLDDKGILDRVIQRAVPNSELIAQQSKRVEDVMKLAGTANTKTKDAFGRFMAAVNDAMDAARNADNAVLGDVELRYKSAQDALSEARKEVDSAVADLEVLGESMRSLFFIDNMGDESLVKVLVDQIDKAKNDLNQMIDSAMGSVEDSKRWLDDFAKEEQAVAALRETLKTIDSQFNDIAETVGKTAVYQQFFATNFDRIMRGEITPSNLPFVYSADIRRGVEELSGIAKGKSVAARGQRRMAAGTREGIQRRLTESSWYKGITQIAPLNDEKVISMTGDTRQRILNNAARMSSTLYETESVGANMIARAHDFFVSSIESSLARRGITDPEQVNQIVRAMMPPELVQAEDELIDAMKVSAGNRRFTMREVGRGKSNKTYNRKEAAERALRLMNSDKEELDVILGEIDNLMAKKDRRLEELRIQNGVQIKYAKDGRVIGVNKKGSGRIVPVQTSDLDEIDGQIRMLRNRAQELESKVHTIGFGQDKTVKKFALNANEQLKPLTRGGKKGLRGADKEPIGGLADLEKYASELEYRTEVMDIKKGQRRAVARANEMTRGAKDVHRNLAVAVERYNIISEIWRRSIATEELMSEMGLQITDNHLRMITESVLNERGNIWQDRVLQIDGARTQLSQLRAALVSAEASGDFGPVEELIAKTFNQKGKKNFLVNVVGTLDSFKIDTKVSGIRKVWDDYERSVRDWRTELDRAKPTQAYGELTRTQETASAIERGAVTDPGLVGEQIARTTEPKVLQNRAMEASDSLVLWYNSEVGLLEKNVDYKIRRTGDNQGVRVLTKSGNKKVREAIVSLQTQTLPSQMIIDIAGESLARESEMISKMTRLFRNVYPFENGKFVVSAEAGGVALDPFADPRAILAGEYQSTPLTVASLFRIQAARIQGELDGIARSTELLGRARGRAADVEASLGLRTAERGAADTGVLPASLAGPQEVPPMPPTRYKKTKAYAPEIANKKKQISELKKKVREASTPQLKGRYRNQLATAQGELAELQDLQMAARPVQKTTPDEQIAINRNLSTEGFVRETPAGRQYQPKEIVDQQYEVNKRLRAIEQTPEFAMAKASQEMYETLKGFAGREMGGISFRDRLVAFVRESGVGQVTDRGGISLADALRADDTIDGLSFSRGEWASLFSGDMSIQTRGRLNKQIAETERTIAELERRASGATSNSVRSRFRNQAQSLRNELEDLKIARQAADPSVRQTAILKFSEINKFIDEFASNFTVTPESVKRFIFSSDYVDGATASSRLDSLQNGWRVTQDYALLKEYNDLAGSAPMRLQRNLDEEIAFLQKRLKTIMGGEGFDLQSIAGYERAIEAGLYGAREEAARAARLSEDVAGVKGIPAGKPANTKPYIPTASELGISPSRLENAGEQALQGVVDRLYKASKDAMGKASREAGLKKTTVKLSQQAESLVRQLEQVGQARLAASTELAQREARLAKLTPIAETVRNQKLKDWEPAIQGLNAILHGTIDKNGKTARKGLYKQLEEAQARIAGRFDKASGAQEAAARRLSEAQVVFGDASLAASYAEGAVESIKPMLVERIEAVNEVLKNAPSKPSGKFDVAARDELTAWGKRAQEVVDRLDADPTNKALALFAEAQIADFQSRAFDQMVVSEKELLDKVKAGFGSKETVALLNEGWVRLGGYTDDELKNLKRLRKGADKTDKKALRKGQVVDLGMPGLQVPKAVAEAMQNVTKTFNAPGGIVRATDFMAKYTQFFKAYATASPGFHVRNAMSDMFSMLSGNADIRNMREALPHLSPYIDDPQGWLNKIPQAQRGDAEKAMQAALASGGGQFTDALDEFMVRGDTWIYNNKFLNMMKRTGHKQDFVRRYMFAYDRIKKGMDVEMATAETRRYLIDYMNPSTADEAVRNIVPFWTFMSRNIPNQLVNRWTNPRAYAIYNSFVRNFDQSTEEDVVPPWMKESGAFKIGGGMWLQPDLPFTRVNQQIAELGQPNRLLSYMNPLLRLPIELSGNTKLYTGQQFTETPQQLSVGSKLASPLLALLGQLQTDASGNVLTSEKANYAIQNLIPPLGTAERLFPSTDQYKERQGASVASWFGLPVRNVPTETIDREANSRKKAMERFMAQQKALGFVE